MQKYAFIFLTSSSKIFLSLCVQSGIIGLTLMCLLKVTMWSLTSWGENCQFAAMFIARVHAHDDTAPDRTHQQALSEVPHKHGDRLLFRCTCQLSPKERGWRRDGR